MIIQNRNILKAEIIRVMNDWYDSKPTYVWYGFGTLHKEVKVICFISELEEAMNELKKEGKVTYIGYSIQGWFLTANRETV